MTFSIPLLVLSIFSLTFFAGCATKNQSVACFKGSSTCYTKQNIDTHETTETILFETKEACTDCFAVLL